VVERLALIISVLLPWSGTGAAARASDLFATAGVRSKLPLSMIRLPRRRFGIRP
jgi:hypothetical protein